MPTSIRFVIILLVLLVAALVETEAPGNRSANWTVCAPHPLANFCKLSKPDGSQASFARSAPEAAQTGQLKFLRKSGIDLRPGGTPEFSRWRHHRDRDPKTPRPGGAADRDLSVAPPGLGIDIYSLPVVTLRSTTG